MRSVIETCWLQINFFLFKEFLERWLFGCFCSLMCIVVLRVRCHFWEWWCWLLANLWSVLLSLWVLAA